MKNILPNMLDTQKKIAKNIAQKSAEEILIIAVGGDIHEVVDGRKVKYNNVWFACISNQPYFGGGMKISPRSKVNDGKIELTIVHNLSRIKLLLLFVTVCFGVHEKLKEVTQFKAEQFTLKVEKTLIGHVDGEKLPLMKNQEIQVKALPQSWKVAIGKK